MKKVVVLVTAGSQKEAEKIARSLVKKGLAACVNIVPAVKSIFKWKGKIETGNELLLLAKTGESRVPELMDEVKALHSYDVPEIIAIPIVKGNKEYLEWVEEVTKRE
ncbi:MAG: divalent-cation tolerance protein CutA [Candidatus Omnitrophica bacterium]|nr:divalent-cation tolerance protein CutA [Candidatus Omnitrophota bacterium]